MRIVVSLVLFACLMSSIGCGDGDQSNTMPPPATQPNPNASTAIQPSFVTEAHSATDVTILPLGAPQSTSILSLNVSGTHTLLLAAWHTEYDPYPDNWSVTNNGVPGAEIVATDGYVGGPGSRSFRIYYWLNPPPGPNTIIVTNPLADSYPNEFAVSIVLLANVDQANPIAEIVKDVSSSPRTSESETVSTTTNDLVVHVIANGLFVRGTLGNGEISRSVANDGAHQDSGDASLWISTKSGELATTTVSSSGWASRAINGVAIAVRGFPTS